MNFTFKKWDEICFFISQNFDTISAFQLKSNKVSNIIVIKHDVEDKPNNALRLAKIENKYGINATYYFQGDLVVDNKKIIQEIKELGHEIGYHYDVMDSNEGEYSDAIIEFSDYLNIFNDIGIVIMSVCPHGNPLKIRSNWSSNKDFFRSKEVQEKYSNIFDLSCHLPKITKFSYISDAGYSWKLIDDFEENDRLKTNDIQIKDIFETISNSNKPLIISTHPHRWKKSLISNFLRKIIFTLSKKIAKKLYKISFLKRLINKFYYLARKI